MVLQSDNSVEMEVYNAARDGKLNTLRTYLDPRPKDEVSSLVQCKVNGATPLIMAARNGHSDVVEFLVDSCLADVEAPGAVSFDGENIDGAPPLWCAAAAGHIGIVKFLIKSGAKVDNTTVTNSTPLRAACFDGHFDIVQYLMDLGADYEIANRHGHTCLMISCYKGHFLIVKYLIDNGANVNRKSLKGNTALHDCAESGSLEIMRLLLGRNAEMEKDSYGLTPLLAAAVTGHKRVVEYLIQRQDCQKHERVEALELLGATYVDKKRDMLGALKYWRMALEERNFDSNGDLQKPKTTSTIAAYESAREVTTVEELHNLISDPDEMRMQALLVRERILGPAHPDTTYYIRYRGAVYADMGNFTRCIHLWLYALEMQQGNLDPLSPMTQSSFLSFAELFSFMMSDERQHKPQIVTFRDMCDILDKAIEELKRGREHLDSVETPPEKDLLSYNRLMVLILHLLSLVCKVQASVTIEEDHQFKQMAYRLVDMKPTGLQGLSLLHLACSQSTSSVGRYPVCTFPSSDVIRLLLSVGAPVSAIDSDGNTPLHTAAANQPCRLEIVELLLKHGAHYDACNKDRKTHYDLLSDKSQVAKPLQFVNLQCLAARAIKSRNIEYNNEIPQKLETFVAMH